MKFFFLFLMLGFFATSAMSKGSIVQQMSPRITIIEVDLSLSQMLVFFRLLQQQRIAVAGMFELQTGLNRIVFSQQVPLDQLLLLLDSSRREEIEIS